MAVRDLWLDLWFRDQRGERLLWRQDFLLKAWRLCDEGAMREAAVHFGCSGSGSGGHLAKPPDPPGLWFPSPTGTVITIRSHPRRPILAVTGSLTVRRLEQLATCEYTGKGWIVLGRPVRPESDVGAEAEFLADVQAQRIMMADALLVVSRDHYVGKGSRLDVALARGQGKEVLWMEPGARDAVETKV